MIGFGPKQPTPGAAGGPIVQTRGVMACFVAERREFDQILWAAEGGDAAAVQVRMGIGLWRQVAFAPKAPQPRCCACLYAFPDADAPEAFFLAIPQRGDGNSLVSGVCRACVRKIGSDGLLARATEHFRKFWPDSKVTGGGMDHR